MGKLLMFEFQKIFSRKIFSSLLVFFLLIEIIMVYRESSKLVKWTYTPENVGDVYDDLNGMTAIEAECYIKEKLNLLNAVDIWRQWADGSREWSEIEKNNFKKRYGKIMLDYPDLNIDGNYLKYVTNFDRERELLSDVLKQISSVAHYQEYLEAIEEKARQMLESSVFGKMDSFAFRNAQKTPAIYNSLNGLILPVADSSGVLLATEFRITDILIMFYLIILSFSMMIEEREMGLLLLVKPTKKGYSETITAKLLVMLIMAVLGTGVLYVTAYTVANYTLGFGDVSRPIQSLHGYLASPYAITVEEYLGMFFLVKLVVAVVFAVVFFCVCVVVKNILHACMATVFILGIEFILYFTIDIQSYLSVFKVINLVFLADTTCFFSDYLNLNIFGYPFSIAPVCLIMSGIVIIGAIGVSIWSFLTENSAHSKLVSVPIWVKVKRRFFYQRHIRVGIFWKEWYKIFVMEGAVLALLIFVVVQLNIYKNRYIYEDNNDVFYHYYIDLVADKTLPEVAEIFREEIKRMEELSKEARVAENAFNADDIKFEEYIRIKTEWKTVSYGVVGFQKALSQYHHVLSQVRQGERAELFYATGWEYLFGNQGQRENVKNAGMLSFVLIVGLAMIFAIEKHTHMELLQNTCIWGKGRVCMCKYAVAIIYSTTAYIIAYLPHYMTTFFQYGLEGMIAPVKSLEMFSDYPWNVPVCLFLILQGVERYFGTLVVTGCILWLSKRLGNTVSTIFVALVVLLLPVFLCLMGITGELFFTFLPFLTGNFMNHLSLIELGYMFFMFCIGIWFYFQVYEEG